MRMRMHMEKSDQGTVVALLAGPKPHNNSCDVIRATILHLLPALRRPL